MTVNCNRHSLPPDWPYRELSQFIASGDLIWHIQRHAALQPSARQTIVLLHGTGAATHSWAEMISGFQALGHVLNLDLPGHGFTCGAEDKDLTLAYVVDELKKLCATLGITGDVILVGHSAGATIAVQWVLPSAAKDPYSIKHVIGLNPSLVPPPPLYTNLLGPVMAPFATSSPMASMIAALAANSGIVDRLLDSTGSNVPQPQRARYRALFSRARHVQGSMRFMAGADLPRLIEQSKTIRCDLSFLIGGQDPWVKPGPLTEIIRKHYPQAHLTTWPGGHILHEESPKEVLRFIQERLLTA